MILIVYNNAKLQSKPHFTTTVVVMSGKNNAGFVFASQACLITTRVRLGSRQHDQLNAKDTDMEKVLLSHDFTLKVLVK